MCDTAGDRSEMKSSDMQPGLTLGISTGLLTAPTRLYGLNRHRNGQIFWDRR